jgi:hypothetical protein
VQWTKSNHGIYSVRKVRNTKETVMDLKSSRFVVCLLGMALAQWALIGRWIDGNVWLIVMTTCLAGFGIVKAVEYGKSGRKPDAPTAEPPALPPAP